MISLQGDTVCMHSITLRTNKHGDKMHARLWQLACRALWEAWCKRLRSLMGAVHHHKKHHGPHHPAQC